MFVNLKSYNGFLKKEDGSRFNQYLFTFAISLCYFSSGQHYAWPTPFLPKILSGDFPSKMTENEASTLASIGTLGDVVGAYTFSFIFDRIGRKYTALLISIPQLLGFVMTYFGPYDKTFLFCARISGGIGEGGVHAIIASCISESVSPNLRGAMNTLLIISFSLGALYVNIIGSFLDMQATALILSITPILYVSIFCFMPESPYYLLMRNRVEEAEESLKILRRRANVDEELNGLIKDVARQTSETGTYKDLFTIPTNRKAVTLILLLRGFQQYGGYPAVLMYMQVMIREATNFSPIWGSCILLLIQMCMCLFSSFFIDRLGRRVLLLTSSTGSFIVLILLGTFFAVRDYTSVDTAGIELLPLVLLMLYIVVYMFGLGPVVAVIQSEIFSTSIKSKAVGLNGLFLALYTLSSVKIYQFLADNAGMSVAMYFFASFTLVGIICIYFRVPETKGRTLEQIQQNLLSGLKNK